jgi:hypothetical protein
MTKEYVSPLAKILAARERKVHEKDISGFFGLAGKQIPKLGIWVPMKSEQDSALDAAHATISAKKTESAKSDEDITRDIKACNILHRCCLDPTPKKRPSDGSTYYDPAFPSPQWMCDHFSTEQIAVLINLVNDVRRIEGPGPKEFDDATVDAFHGAAVKADPDGAADFLAGCDREFLAQLYIAEAHELEAARREVEVLQAEIERLRAPEPAEPPGQTT